MDLYPNYDNYFDVKKAPVPDQNIDINIAAPLMSLVGELNKLTCIQDPRSDIVSDSTTSQLINSSTSQSTSVSGRTKTTTTTQTDSYENTRKVIQAETRKLFKADTSGSSTLVGEFVRDSSFSPYIREQNIQFHAFGLRPNVRHYVFFDETAMSSKTRPATVPDGLTISRKFPPHRSPWCKSCFR